MCRQWEEVRHGAGAGRAGGGDGSGNRDRLLPLPARPAASFADAAAPPLAGPTAMKHGPTSALAATAAAVGTPGARGVGGDASVGVRPPSGDHVLQRASVDTCSDFKNKQTNHVGAQPTPTWVTLTLIVIRPEIDYNRISKPGSSLGHL